MSRDFWDSNEGVFLSGRGIPDLPTVDLDGLPEGAVLFGSSGSSGAEKWVVHTRATLNASAEAVNNHLQVTAADTFGLLLPFFHVGGAGVVARAHLSGAGLVEMGGKWNASRALEFLGEKGVTVTSMVPTQVYDIVRAHLQCPPSLRAIIVGGGTLSVEIGQRARELGWPVLQSYGMSEAGSQVATASLDSVAVDFTNDRLEVLPIWELAIVDGALEVTGKALCKGILTKDGYQRINVCQTTDRVELSDGRLSFLARNDRTVKVRGELVNLDAMERKLATIIGGEVAIIATPHPRAGFTLHGFSECRFPDDINQELPPYARLNSFHTVEELPRGALGKLDRRALVSHTF